ncbi:aminoglycoside adenylyltransferase domain-containing protein [Psychrobacillus sp. FSL H8-0484]|uniref:nucleotidyltransferase domain-containing protein n=1 Tax=Psychrobacillus sp. FSL H8-0484 TaxID=2921390 RepID=UPI0030F97C58
MSNLKNALPVSVTRFMQTYLQALNVNLSDRLIEGVYIYGSIALGAFNEEKSDIDFIVLLKRPVNDQEVEIMKGIHSQMCKSNYGSRMDGVYVQVNSLGKTNEELSPYPYCAEGNLSIGHWDVNHITWWVLKQHGITLQGTPIGELDIPTKWEDVLKTLNYNINHYWFNHTKDVSNFLSDEMIEFTTTTICRIICSLELQHILSKDGAVVECLKMLPERWHPLIKEGNRIRTEISSKSFYESDVRRAEECRDFVLYAHQVCNENFFMED